MIVKLFDGLEITISKDAGDKLNKSMSTSKDGMVTLNGITVKKSAIAYMKPGGYTLAEVERPEVKLLQEPDRKTIGSKKPLKIGEVINGSRKA